MIEYALLLTFVASSSLLVMKLAGNQVYNVFSNVSNGLNQPPPPPINPPASTGPPTITGTTTAGQTLTEGHGTWTNNPTSYSYQWQDCNTSGSSCTNITGATSQTYLLTAADVGHTIRVQESATNAGGTGGPATSLPTAVVNAACGPCNPPANTAPPTISGNTIQGQMLTESHGTWTNSPASYAYQWQDCDSAGNNCVAISGATGQTYVLAASDVGSTIRVEEWATNAVGTGGPAVSVQTAVVTSPPPPPPNNSDSGPWGYTWFDQGYGSFCPPPVAAAYPQGTCGQDPYVDSETGGPFTASLTLPQAIGCPSSGTNPYCDTPFQVCLILYNFNMADPNLATSMPVGGSGFMTYPWAPGATQVGSVRCSASGTLRNMAHTATLSATLPAGFFGTVVSVLVNDPDPSSFYNDSGNSLTLTGVDPWCYGPAPGCD